MIVYLLWHIHHFAEDEAGNILHHEESGDVTIDEQEGDDAKILGIYSSQAKAEERIVRARLLDGFRDEPDCFQITEYKLDHDEWREGYVTEYHE
ncbi:MAG: hypothetical protein JWL97_4188 [Gemmatimonadales bacterium]|jgi:hypothetical protein|nr:hypothetical protein [Gemmatimonadales bacterium]